MLTLFSQLSCPHLHWTNSVSTYIKHFFQNDTDIQHWRILFYIFGENCKCSAICSISSNSQPHIKPNTIYTSIVLVFVHLQQWGFFSLLMKFGSSRQPDWGQTYSSVVCLCFQSFVKYGTISFVVNMWCIIDRSCFLSVLKQADLISHTLCYLNWPIRTRTEWHIVVFWSLLLMKGSVTCLTG